MFFEVKPSLCVRTVPNYFSINSNQTSAYQDGNWQIKGRGIKRKIVKARQKTIKSKENNKDKGKGKIN